VVDFTLRELPVVPGMVLLSLEAPAVCCQQFEADVYVLYHCNKITKNFQTTVHIGTICQTAVFTHISRVSKPLLGEKLYTVVFMLLC
jgi:GTPase